MPHVSSRYIRGIYSVHIQSSTTYDRPHLDIVFGVQEVYNTSQYGNRRTSENAKGNAGNTEGDATPVNATQSNGMYQRARQR